MLNVGIIKISDVKVNTLNISPEKYDRKIKTQRNWRELIKNGGACGLIR